MAYWHFVVSWASLIFQKLFPDAVIAAANEGEIWYPHLVKGNP